MALSNGPLCFEVTKAVALMSVVPNDILLAEDYMLKRQALMVEMTPAGKHFLEKSDIDPADAVKYLPFQVLKALSTFPDDTDEAFLNALMNDIWDMRHDYKDHARLVTKLHADRSAARRRVGQHTIDDDGEDTELAEATAHLRNVSRRYLRSFRFLDGLGRKVRVFVKFSAVLE